VDSESGNYYPIIYFNEFWLLRDKLIAVNETVDELPLTLEVGLISLTKWQWYLQIDQSFQLQKSYGSMLEGEADELKVIHVSFVAILILKSHVGPCKNESVTLHLTFNICQN
jgi:Cleft lip and palate transmembrane protein 1 (CLPTM1)